MAKNKSKTKQGRPVLTPKTQTAMHRLDSLELNSPTQGNGRRVPKPPKKALTYSNKKRAISSSDESDSSSLSELDSDVADEDEEEDEESEEDDDDEDDQPLMYRGKTVKGKTASRKTASKTPHTPQKQVSRVPRRRNSSGNDSSDADSESSDDDAYEGVEDISDSDGEEPDVEKLEEENILAEEIGSQVALSSVADFSEHDFDDGQLFQEGSINDYDDVISAYRHRSRSETPARRSVHWADTAETVDDGLSSELSPQFIDDDDEYSDIDPDPRLFEETGTTSDFVSQDNLDPDLRRMIEDDGDFSEHYTPYRGQGIIVEHDTTDNSFSSSGYDSMFNVLTSALSSTNTNQPQPMKVKLLMMIYRQLSRILSRSFIMSHALPLP